MKKMNLILLFTSTVLLALTSAADTLNQEVTGLLAQKYRIFAVSCNKKSDSSVLGREYYTIATNKSVPYVIVPVAGVGPTFIISGIMLRPGVRAWSSRASEMIRCDDEPSVTPIIKSNNFSTNCDDIAAVELNNERYCYPKVER